ncbi:hypothetical protein V4E48_002645 [Morganella morganii]|nr:hypothetical protein [Morganella morganii]
MSSLFTLKRQRDAVSHGDTHVFPILIIEPDRTSQIFFIVVIMREVMPPQCNGLFQMIALKSLNPCG